MLPWLSSRMWVKYCGGAASISAPAKYGVDAVTACWPSPIGVSFGLVKKRAIVKNDTVIAAPTFHLVLNFDRRIMAGASAAKLFARFVDYLEQPEKMLGTSKSEETRGLPCQ